LLGTIAYRLNGRTTYAIEGSIFVAGAAVQWLRDGMGLLGRAAESEALARSVRDNNEVYFVPAFTGLGAPYWNPDARAIITGLTRESTRAHIVRATLEAQGYQTLDLMQAMEKDSGHRILVLRADGGLMSNRFAAQHVADMVRCRVDVPRVYETTAWGAACLAGLQVGVFKDLNDITRRWRAHKKYGPVMKPAQRGVLYEGWQRAVRQALAV
jgi:glycerol kinase